MSHIFKAVFYLVFINQAFSADKVNKEEFMKNGHKYAEMMGHLNDPVAKMEFMRNGGMINVRVQADHGNTTPSKPPEQAQESNPSDHQQNTQSNFNDVFDDFLKHLEIKSDKNIINVNLTATNVPGGQIIINLCNENVTINTGNQNAQNRSQND